MSPIILWGFFSIIIFTTAHAAAVYPYVSGQDYNHIPRKFHIDNFDNCLLLEKEALYCTFNYTLRPLNPQAPSKAWNIIKTLQTDLINNYDHARLYHGICVPLTCPNATGLYGSEPAEFRAELTRCYDAKYESKGLRGDINNLHCQTAEPLPVDTVDKLVAVAAACYLGFIAYATIVDAYLVPEGDAKRGSILRCFSLAANWERLKSVGSSPEANRLNCMHGMKVFNTWIVIMSHSTLLYLVGPIVNTRHSETVLIESPQTEVFFASGTFVMQTYLLITAWLFSYQMCSGFNGKKITLKSLGLIYFGRLFRIWPTLIAVLLFHCTWLRHFTNGPFFDEIVGHEFRNCRKNWLTNLFFISTAYPADETCMQQTWYLNVDNLYTIITLGLFYIIWKNKKYVALILGSALCINLSLLGYFVYSNNLIGAIKAPREQILFTIEVMNNADQFYLLMSPYNSGSALIIGLGWGYFYYFYKDKQFFTTKLRVTLFWIFGFITAVSVAFGTAGLIFSKYWVHDPFWVTLLVCVSRPLYCFSLGLMIFGMSQNIGWIMKWILEWRPLLIIGKVGYSAFLVNIMITKIRAGSRRSPSYMHNLPVVFESCSDVAMSSLIGLLLTLLVEMPFGGVQIYLFKNKSAEKINEKCTNNNNILDTTPVKKIK